MSNKLRNIKDSAAAVHSESERILSVVMTPAAM